MNREDRIDKFNDLFSPSFGCPTDFEEGDEPLDFVCQDFIKGKYIIDIWFKGEFLLTSARAKFTSMTLNVLKS